MLFRQSDLAYDPIQEANNILNESIYLDESESITSAKAIPVVENSRIGAYIVRFNDISNLSTGIHNFKIVVTYNGETKIKSVDKEYEA